MGWASLSVSVAIGAPGGSPSVAHVGSPPDCGTHRLVGASSTFFPFHRGPGTCFPRLNSEHYDMVMACEESCGAGSGVDPHCRAVVVGRCPFGIDVHCLAREEYALLRSANAGLNPDLLIFASVHLSFVGQDLAAGDSEIGTIFFDWGSPPYALERGSGWVLLPESLESVRGFERSLSCALGPGAEVCLSFDLSRML